MLAGGFFTSEPPGKPRLTAFKKLLMFALFSLSLFVCSVCPQPVRVKDNLLGIKMLLSKKKKKAPVQSPSQTGRHISVFFKCFGIMNNYLFQRTVIFPEPFPCFLSNFPFSLCSNLIFAYIFLSQSSKDLMLTPFS